MNAVTLDIVGYQEHYKNFTEWD